jgi:hypothetical protein
MIITTLILLALVAFGIYLSTTDKYDIIGVFVTVIIGFFTFFFHIPCLLLKEYDYNMFMVKRDAFESTLNETRESGRELEAAAILREVSEWNIELAERKYDNTTFFFDQYTDDRIMNIKPIK